MKHWFGPVVGLLVAAGAVVLVFTKHVERGERMTSGAPQVVTDGEQQGDTEVKPIFLRGRGLNAPPVGTTNIDAIRVHIK